MDEQSITITTTQHHSARQRHEIPLSSALTPRPVRAEHEWLALAHAEHETDVLREVLAELINRLAAEPGVSIKYTDLLAKLNSYR